MAKQYAFKSVEVKNFLSFGNTPTKFEFDNGLTLIHGKNGSGKTALVFDAIIFALYGTTSRGLLKNQIANFINRQNCIVRLEMELDGKDLVIERGVAPDGLDIAYDGESIFTELTTAKKQNPLNDLLGMSLGVAEQLLFIGAKHQSFMSRTPAGRREFVNRILNLEAFNDIDFETKRRLKQQKTQLAEKQSAYKANDQELNTLINLVENIREPDADLIETLTNDIASGEKQLKKATSIHEGLMNDVEIATNATNELRLEYAAKASEFEKLQAAKDKCYACGQDIDISEQQKQAKELEPVVNELKDKLTVAQNLQKEASSKMAKFNEQLDRAKSKLREFTSKLEAEQAIDVSIADSTKARIETLATEQQELSASIKQYEHDIAMLNVIASSLRKEEAKSKLIENVLPLINDRISYYVDSLGLQLSVQFDSKFNETFLARYRDTASYENYSSGQQLKLDFVILLAWHDVASHLNSIQLNTCIVDEFGNNLDANNLQQIVEVLRKSGRNFIALMPRQPDIDDFDHIYNVEYAQNFSKLVTVQ